LQRGRIVDAVADKGDSFALRLEFLDQFGLLFRANFGEHIVRGNASLPRLGQLAAPRYPHVTQRIWMAAVSCHPFRTGGPGLTADARLWMDPGCAGML